MRHVIIWHLFIKNLVGTWSRNDVDATSLRRIDVRTMSSACWEFDPPWPPNILNLTPQYSKPPYAYGGYFEMSVIEIKRESTVNWYNVSKITYYEGDKTCTD